MDRDAGENGNTPVPTWGGTSRYEVRKRIGAGGMGVVYEAFDHERGRLVAVKTLLRFSPSALYRFKHEFRTISDEIHPNLVRLYELVIQDGEDAFFAMELVDGVDFLRYVTRPDASLRADRAILPTAAVALVPSTAFGNAPTRFEPGSTASEP